MGIQNGRRFRHAALLLAACVLQAQTWGTFHAAYQDGLAAQARGDHTLAVKAFTQAAALQPTPGTRVHTYALNFLPTYYPYLRLAESALALGDLARAEAALANPASVAGEPAAQREALLARIRLRVAYAPVTVSAAPPAAQPVPAKAPAPAEAERPQLPPSPTQDRDQPRAAPPRPKEATPRPAALPPVAAPAGPQGTAPPPALTPAPMAAPAPPSRWPWLLGGLGVLAAAGGLALRQRRRGPAPATAPWADPAAVRHDDPTLGATRDPNLDRAFGPWVARRVLGRGGCATAYYAVHRNSGQEAALKVPHAHLVQDQEFLARFRREAILGARLDHPRIVGILDPGPPEGDPWLALPYVQGTTLEAYLARNPTLPIPEAVRIAADVAEAMAYAHAKGIVHRDLKPANIMLAGHGAVVMDLGIARSLEGGKHTSMYIGTPTYSAPECIVDPSVGPPADRYALGIILFEMLAGHPPFQGENAFQVLEAHRFDPLPDLAALRPMVPPRLQRLTERLCHKAPEERPEDGETLLILKELAAAFPL